MALRVDVGGDRNVSEKDARVGDGYAVRLEISGNGALRVIVRM